MLLLTWCDITGGHGGTASTLNSGYSPSAVSHVLSGFPLGSLGSYHLTKTYAEAILIVLSVE